MIAGYNTCLKLKWASHGNRIYNNLNQPAAVMPDTNNAFSQASGGMGMGYGVPGAAYAGQAYGEDQ